MKKLTALLALLTAVSCLTACETDAGQSAGTTTAAQTTAAQTISAESTETTAAQSTTAAGTTASTAAQSTAAESTETTAAQSTTTAETTTTAAAKKIPVQPVKATVEGHIWGGVADILTEYPGQKDGEGIVLLAPFQATAFCITLPLEECKKLEIDKGYTLVLPKQEIMTDNFHVTRDEDGNLCFGAYYAEIGLMTKNYRFREAQPGDQGLDRDAFICSDASPTDNLICGGESYESLEADPVKYSGSFTATVIKKYPEYAYDPDGPDRSVLLMLDGQPVYAVFDEEFCKRLEAGKEYTFRIDVTEDGELGTPFLKESDLLPKNYYFSQALPEKPVEIKPADANAPKWDVHWSAREDQS